MEQAMHATARHETPHGSKYLQQLCKHFGHKVEVRYDAESGDAALPPGPARFAADEGGLSMTVTAENAEGLATAKRIVEIHLVRFAFREKLEALDWSA